MTVYLFHGVVLAIVDTLYFVDAAEGAFAEFGLDIELVELAWGLHSNIIWLINRTIYYC